MDLNLRGKVTIVTGAGRGIGKAIALAFAQEGASVVVNDIDEEVAKEVAEEIVSLRFQSLAVRTDVTKADQVEEMVSQTLDEFGRLDILVNNAGIVYEAGGPIGRKPFIDLLFEDWHKEIDLILFGTMNCIKAVLPHMVKQKRGRIINISSDLGRTSMGLKGFSIYGAGKGGLLALTRNIASEVASYGITINAVSPGMVRTTRALLAERQKETRPEEYEYYRNLEINLVAAIPLGRMGEPEDIAKLVVFLSSDAAGWITGQTFSINGGMMMI